MGREGKLWGGAFVVYMYLGFFLVLENLGLCYLVGSGFLVFVLVGFVALFMLVFLLSFFSSLVVEVGGVMRYEGD